MSGRRDTGGRWRTLVDVLVARAREGADRSAYLFLAQGEEPAGELTYGELEARARAVAAALAGRCAPGDRALLAFPPGLDFVVAFFGCLLAGVVAVPAYPPHRRRRSEALEAIVADAAPAVVLSDAALAGRRDELRPETLAALPWIAVDALGMAGAASYEPPPVDPGSAAFLQYTSGSTSSPKGVVVSHANLLHNQEMIRRAFAQDADSVVVSWLPLYHDMGLIGGVLQPLYCGGRCVLMAPLAFLQRPRRWLEAIDRYRATTSGGPDFAYALCVEKVPPAERAGLDLSSWRVAFDGSEPVRPETLDRFAAAFAPCGFRRGSLLPCYGLAEATLFVAGPDPAAEPTVAKFSAAGLRGGRAEPAAAGEPTRALTACGAAWMGQRLEVVDPADGRPLPPGRVGEVWVSGPSVAGGYWRQPELSERTFRARLAGEPGSPPFLRTGDLGCVVDGELYLAGRLKDLIILRGRNHHPEDVERTASAAHPALLAGGGAAFSVEADGAERLVVVHELARQETAPAAEVAAAVRAAVSEAHEAAVHDVVLIRPRTLPRTSSGKVRRGTCRDRYLAGSLEPLAGSGPPLAVRVGPGDAAAPLPATAGAGFAIGRDDLLALSPEERPPVALAALRRAAAALTGRPPAELPGDRPTTGLGLDSLRSVELAHAVQAALGVPLTGAEVMDAGGLRALAAELVERLAAGDAPAPAAPAAGEGEAESEGESPLAPNQQSLWFLHRLAPESAAYNVPVAVRLFGAVDADALVRSVRRLVARHPMLRATFHDRDDGPVFRVHAEARLELDVADATGWSEEELAARVQRAAYAPFDLAAGPPLRLALYRRPAGSTLVLSLHHAVCDFWSLGVIARELEALVRRERGEPVDEPPVPGLAYAAHAAALRERLAGEEGRRLEAAWREHLAPLPPRLELPGDRPRPSVPGWRGGAVSRRLAGDLAGPFRQLAESRGVTPFAVAFAAFATLLARLAGGERLLLGTPGAGRDDPAAAGVVGYFVNPVAVRADLAGDPSFGDLVERLARSARWSLAHQEMPLARLAERLGTAGSAAAPLVDVLFVWYQALRAGERSLAALALAQPEARGELLGLPAEPFPLAEEGAQFELALAVGELDGALAASLRYSADRFDRSTAERLLERFERLLSAAVRSPETRLWSLPLLSEAERRQVVVEWNATAAGYAGSELLHEAVAEQAARTPEAPAVRSEGAQLSYRELMLRWRSVASRLRELGVGPEVRVGVCAERSLDLMVAYLGVLAAGGVVVPVDPESPRERLAYLLGDALAGSAVPVVLAQAAWAERVGEALPGARVVEPAAAASGAAESFEPPALDPDSAAYVIYTSGSTGRPKGAVNSHRGIVNRLRWGQSALPLGPADRVLQKTPVSFDVSLWELFWPLVSGACLVMARPGGHREPSYLVEVLESEAITTVHFVPSLLRVFLEEPGLERCGSVRRVLASGEALSPELVARFHERFAAVTGAELHNLYGPTEAAVEVSWWPCREPRPATVPIGHPVSNVRLHVLDRAGGPVPAGVAGELHLGGVCLARGYHGRPGLTAERFVPDPLAAERGEPGARLYRTGDAARHRADGAVEYLGRLDDQVKIRGFRVEPGEVESALAAHPGVRQAAVVARADARGDLRLVAYVAGRGGPPPESEELAGWAARRLPAYMVPSAWVTVAELPRTASGKLDRRALPEPPWTAGDAAAEGARTPLEELLAGQWAEVLELPAVGREESFFDLGGHSLLAARLTGRLRDRLGVEVAVRDLFASPTVAGLAERLAGREAAAAAPPVRPVERQPHLPLSFAQERLWFLDRLEPGTALYNMAASASLAGTVSQAALEQAVGEIVRRHEVLRTTYGLADERPVQSIRPAAPVAVPVVDLSGLPAGERERQLGVLRRREAVRPFDLAADPMVRVRRLLAAPAEGTLLATFHHVAFDGGSVTIVAREMAALWAAYLDGRPSPLAEPQVQYADYAVWQRSLPESHWQRDLDDWRERLADLPESLDLAADRPPAERLRRGARIVRPIPEEVAAELVRLSRRLGATPFMVVAAALHALLGRLAGRGDVAVGVPVAGRVRPEVEETVGFFVNTLVLRARFADDPAFAELVARERAAMLAAHDHQELPFERLVEALQPERTLGSTPLVQVLLVDEHAAASGGGMALPGLAVGAFEMAAERAKLDLTFAVAGFAGAAAARHLALEYDADRFDRSTAERLLERFERLLSAAVRSPQTRLWSLPLLSPAERRQVVVEWNATAAAHAGSELLHEAVGEQAARTPEAPAVRSEGAELTYRELALRWRSVASRLRELGVGPEVRVGVCAERSLDLVVAYLGVLAAGGVVVPVDPESPRERLAYLLGDALAGSAVPVVLAQAAWAERVGEALPGARVVELAAAVSGGASGTAEPFEPPALDPDSAAYVIYTSGSTGRPKGAVNSHRGIVNRLRWGQATLPLGSGDRVLQKTPVSFDVSLWELFWPLVSGACLVMARPGGHREPSYLVEVLESEAITTVHFVPSLLRVFLEEPGLERCGSVRRVLASGEALSPELVARFHERFAAVTGAELHNLYGPTEAAVEVSWWPCREPRPATVPIGHPVSNVRLHVLDRAGGPVPAGVAGELHLGGVCLARGYHGRPGLTAERFVPDPLAAERGEPGARLYRTGDAARHRADGAVEYLGRLDDQVKIRGFRVEPGEVESALAAHPGVRQAAVVARADARGDLRLVAYVAGRGGPPPESEELAGWAARRLPAYMVPSAWVTVAELPRTASGKLDRRALPEPPWTAGDAAAEGARTPLEELLAGQWAEVLELPAVGREESFFDLGGHSLLAARLTGRLRDRLGVEVAVRDLFASPTVAGLAERLAGREAAAAAPPVRPVERQPHLPLSFAQERLWFLDRLEPGTALYNMAASASLAGTVSQAALEQAVGEIVRRHEVLRTTYGLADERPVQSIRPAAPVAVPVVDLSGLPAGERERQLGVLRRREAVRPFDLAADPMVRVRRLLAAPAEGTLLATFHHVAFDGGSVTIVAREMAALWAAYLDGRPSPLAEPQVQYADYAVWQRSLPESHWQRDLDDWRERLADLPESLDLAADRPPAERLRRGARIVRPIPEEVAAELVRLSRRLGATPFMVVAAALHALLGRLAGRGDVAVGVPVAGRVRPEVEETVGFFVNTLVLRARFADDPAFAELVARERAAMLAAHDHQELPFERLVEALQPERTLGSTPLVQVLLVDEHAAASGGGMALPGLAVGAFEMAAERAKLDLTFAVAGFAGAAAARHLALEYDADRFDRSTAERLLERFERLLSAAVRSPETRLWSLPLLSEAERRQVVVEWNATAAGYAGSELLHEAVGEQAARTPEAPAVRSEGAQLSYRELTLRWRSVASRLRELGVGPEVRVGVCAERSLDLVVAYLGVLAAGGVVVPVDPESPRERLAYLLGDALAGSAVPVVLAQAAWAERVGEALPGARVVELEAASGGAAEPFEPPALDPDSAAYVIYTSGSTGRPKGAVNSHRGIVNRLRWGQATLPLGSGDRVLQKTPVSFDVSLWELFWPLVSGACLVMARPGGHREPSYLVEVLESEAITTVHFVPSLLRVFLEEPGLERCGSVRRVLASGEALSPELVARFHERFAAVTGAELHNLYGPTEAAVEVSWWPCREPRPVVVPIGHPVSNVRLHVLDRAGGPVPAGVTGELHLGGVCLARGYHGRPGLTAERFVPDPLAGERGEPGARLYRTGDAARHRADGLVEYLGRLDDQVKIRGFRVEPGEVESALAAHPGVRQAAVVARPDARGDLRLVAYVAGRGGEAPEAEELARWAARRLPAYMVPSAWVTVAELPRTASGKLDRRALPEPPWTAGDAAAEGARTPLEELLAGQWAEVLELPAVGREESFFDLGGHSLLAARLTGRLRDRLGIDVAVRDLFASPTVAGLAERLAGREAAAAAPPLERLPRDGELPLSFAQEGLWFLDRLRPGDPAYNGPFAVRVGGSLRVAILARVLSEIVARHEALRTSFPERDGRPVQVIAPPAPVPLPVVDLGAIDAARRRTEARRGARREMWRPFDLAAGPLFRAALWRLDPEDHLLVVNLHHMVSDAWSGALVMREVTALFPAFAAGRPSPLPPLPVQYADFAAWQRRRLDRAEEERLVAWWRQRLGGTRPTLRLPGERAGSGRPSHRGGRLPVRLPDDLAAALSRLGRQEGATLFMVLLAGLATLLYRRSGQDDVVIGTDMASRDHPAGEALIGFFINMLALRVDLSGNPTFRELLRRARESALGAFAHRDLPFDRVVEAVRPERDLSHSPLFRVVLVLDNTPAGEMPGELAQGPGLPPLTLAPEGFEDAAMVFDLTLWLRDAGGRLEGWWGFSRDLFDRPAVAALQAGLEAVLRRAVAHPEAHLDALKLLDDEEGERRRDLREAANLDRLAGIRRRRGGARA